MSLAPPIAAHYSEKSQHDNQVTTTDPCLPPSFQSLPQEKQSEQVNHVNSIDQQNNNLPVINQVDPVDGSREQHVLPVGSQVDPVDQAKALNKAPSHVVAKEVEKVKANKREERGERPKGTIINGIEDDQLWTMLRRFNMQVSQVLSPPTSLPLGQPDLRPSTLPTVPFNSDALKNNAERLYASAGVAAIVFVREMQRLMSWDRQERRRTLAFAISYFVSWWFSLVIPAIVGLLITLVVFPQSRALLFPSIPAPVGVAPSALDPTNKKGDESLMTGIENPVVHRSKAEQVEQQSKEIINLAQRFGAKVLIGGRTKKGEGNAEVGKKAGEALVSSDDDDENEIRGGELDTTEQVGEDGKTLTPEQLKQKTAKEAKAKREMLVNKIAKGLQDALGNTADLFERFNHALNPPPYFPGNQARIKIASLVLLPILLAFATIPAHIWSQIVGLAFGIGFFAQPLLIRAGKKFLKFVPLPVLEEKLDLRNSILSGVPSDAQVVIYLLRVSEANYKPVPAPPSAPTSKHLQSELDKPSIDTEIEEAEQGKIKTGDAQDAEAEEEEEEEEGLGEKVVRKGKGKFIGALRKTAAKVAKFGADVRDAKEDDTAENEEEATTLQKVGNKVDKFLFSSTAEDDRRPESYPAKFDGKSGFIQIHHSRSDPISTISFLPLRSSNNPSFVANLEDLVEVKKSGVWIGRLALGYAANLTLEGMGIEMRFKSTIERQLDGIGKENEGIGGKHDETHEGEVLKFEHVARRDQLFGRLISIENQKWEAL